MKKVIVTGASRGIGESITSLFLERNFKVIGTAVKSSFPDSFLNNENFRGIHADLNDIEDLSSTLKELIIKEKPDVLVNNAGVFEACDFEESDEKWLQNWDRTQSINLRSAALLCKWFTSMHLQDGNEGVIINIASRAAYRGDGTDYTSYAASKGGLVAFTKSIARGYGRKGIYAYSVAPGFIETDMAVKEIEKIGRERITSNSAFDEITKPHEIAELVCWLAEGKVTHATGSTFHVNGGSYVI